MEAQQIITMSINKITGSRGQRGGVNLRKNLLVATVLHSARAMYYEEMCNRMARNAELYSRERDMRVEEEEEDCTEAPDWGDSGQRDSGEAATPAPCERVVEGEASHRPTQDKENCHPASTTDVCSVQDRLKPEPDTTPLVSDSTQDKERMVLGQKNTNSPQQTASSPSCTAGKRKRSDSSEELREACESIIPKRAKPSDSECQTEELSPPAPKQASEGCITSLVSIFKSGFHGLSGEGNAAPKTTNIVSGSNNHLQPSPYTSSMPRPFEQRQMPIAAC